MERGVTFGRYRFDPQTGQLWSGRREVRLTPKAAGVLAALVEHAGQPVTRVVHSLAVKGRLKFEGDEARLT